MGFPTAHTVCRVLFLLQAVFLATYFFCAWATPGPMYPSCNTRCAHRAECVIIFGNRWTRVCGAYVGVWVWGGSWHPGRTPDAVPQASRATRDLCGSRSTSVCTAAPARFCGEPMSMVYRGPIPFPFVSTPIARENPSSTRESSGVHIQLKDRLTLAWRGGHAVW